MLTEQQKNNVSKMPFEDLIELSDLCDEILGTSLQSEFKKIVNFEQTREHLQVLCKEGKIKSKKIGNKTFPYVNVYLEKLK